MNKAVLMLALLAVAVPVQAKPAATSKQNFSGIYACKGSNELVGKYEITVTLKLKRLNDSSNLANYEYTAQTENSVNYVGQAISTGNRLALSFKLGDSRNADFTTGTAEVKKNALGRYTFTNLYYESDDTGGNFGSETCVFKDAVFAEVPAKAPASKTPAKKAAH